MVEPRLSTLLIGSCNLSNLAGLIVSDADEPPLEPVLAPFGQVMELLVDRGAECWRQRPEAVMVWTRAEDISPAYGKLRRGETVEIDSILAEVDRFAAAVIEAAERAGTVLLPTWSEPLDDRGLGMLDMRPGVGVAHTLMRMNVQLAEGLAAASNVFLLDSRRWLAAAPQPALARKLWHMAKVPHTAEVFRAAVVDVKAALRGVRGGARKLVIVDLDDTLWGGIVGDLGWEKLRLGGHDHLGEAYLDFQLALQALTRRGVILGIVSKNEEEIALAAVDRHPEMVLRCGDFAGWRINWHDKAANVVELAEELGLGLQSVVFLDDNPVERARVREALPEVLVPELPADPMLFTSTLLGLTCFDTPALSREDRDRAAMYAAQRQRRDARRELSSPEEWLRSLETVVRVETLSAANLGRAAQLLNKTNQMNLRTRRMTEPELEQWAAAPGRRLWTFRVRDRFGDSGLTGLASLSVDGAQATVEDFVLSCRVMGRRVEETMLHVLVAAARSAGAQRLAAELLPTAKNAPCRRFFEGSGLQSDGEDRYLFNLGEPYPAPDCLELEGEVDS